MGKSINNIVFNCIFILCLIISLNSCMLVKKIAGADFDSEQFAKYRQAKIMEVRLEQSYKLMKKISSQGYDSAEVSVLIKESLLQQVSAQYENSSGWLDEATSYSINSTKIKLQNGCCIANLNLLVYNSTYAVNVNLVMDCLLTFQYKDSKIVALLEPFNISPDVSTGLLLKPAQDIIQNVLTLKLGDLKNLMPEFSIPTNLANSFNMKGTRTNIRDKINLTIDNPDRKIEYTFKMKDVLIFESAVLVLFDVEKIDFK